MTPSRITILKSLAAALTRQTCTPITRHIVAEWTVTAILLLFGTTTLLQAFVVPTSSMDDTLRVGDHLIVD